MNSKYRDDYLFKVIIAIKINHSKLQTPVKLTIEIQEKKKICSLPLMEGQFFDFTELNLSKPIKFLFHQEKSGRLIGQTQIILPNDVLTKSESEISSDFQIDPTIKEIQLIKGSYYIIIQNKQLTLEKLRHVEKNQKEKEFDVQKQRDNENEKQGQKLIKTNHTRSFSSKSPMGKTLPVNSLKAEKIIKKLDKKKLSKNDTQNVKDLNDFRKLNQSMEINQEVTQSLQVGRQNLYTLNSHQDSQEDIDKSKSHSITEFSPKKNQYQQNCHSPSRSINSNNFSNSKDIDSIEQKYEKQQKDVDDIIDLRKQVVQFSNRIENVQNQNDLGLEQSKLRITEFEANQQIIQKENLQVRLNQVENRNKELDRLRETDGNCIADLNQAYNKQQQIFQAQIEDMKNTIWDLEQFKINIQNEFSLATSEIIKLKNELTESQEKQQELKSVIDKNEKSAFYTLQNQVYEQMLKSFQDQFNEQKQDFNQIQDDLVIMRKKYENSIIDTSQLQQKYYEQEKQHLKNNELLRIRLTEIENKSQQQQNIIDEKNQQISQLSFQNKVYSRDFKWLKDSNHQLEEIKQRNQQFSNIISEYQQREESLQKNVKELNSQLQDKDSEIAKMSKELKEAQEYAYQLKTLILEMKENGVCYIPYHQDPIDKALGDFINSMNDPERLKNLFFRESEGVYLFGSRKIFAKLEQDRLLIRTGGGYIGMEEFLDMYATSEIEKMEKHDPKKYWELNQNLSAVLDQSRTIRENARLQSSIKKFSPNK